MQGPTENVLMIVAAGNAFLGGRGIAGFWPDSPTFTFIKLWEFRLGPASEPDEEEPEEVEYPLMAADPIVWFQSLKPWCSGLRLHHAVRRLGPDQQMDTPDRMLTAFVGGGPQWLIEAVGEPKSQIWESFHRFGDRHDPEQKIWHCASILQGEMLAADSEPQDLGVALSDLRIVLPEIEAFARSSGAENFASYFANAQAALSSRSVEALPWVEMVRRHTGFTDWQLNVLMAINHAWMFGGMGSWNDLGLGGEPYDSLSERLYVALNDTIAGLANSTFRG